VNYIYIPFYPPFYPPFEKGGAKTFPKVLSEAVDNLALSSAEPFPKVVSEAVKRFGSTFFKGGKGG